MLFEVSKVFFFTRIHKWRRRIAVGALCLLLSTFAACANHGHRNVIWNAPASGGVATHVVQHEGETLASISKQYSGTAVHWHAIQAENPGVDPRKLKVGQKILIPPSLRRRHSLDLKTNSESNVRRNATAKTSPAANYRGTNADAEDEKQAQNSEPSMEDEMFRDRLIEAVLSKRCDSTIHRND